MTFALATDLRGVMTACAFPQAFSLVARPGTYDEVSMTDEDIIAAFRRGDDRATATLYERYGQLVFTVCLRMINDRSRAQDAVQQTFVQAWRSANSFDPSKSFGPWLATIARRVSIDMLRADARHQNQPIETGDAVVTDPALITLPPNVEQIEAVWKVREALEALAPEDRLLIKMQHFEGAAHADIAARLGIPLGTVKSRAFRIHRELARTLRSLSSDVSNDVSSDVRNPGEA
jgi:RNA polymerase sigma factor (sigma-70 family)